MNNEEFCQAIGHTNGIERELAGKIRDVTATLCKLDSDAITPGDDTDRLSSRMGGWDEVQFLMELERVLDVPFDGIQLPNFVAIRFFFLYRKAKSRNYGEWVKSAVEVLAPVVVRNSRVNRKS
jgi:hypothetical protein